MKHARANGIDITADQYPYTASGTSVGASLLPRWAEAGGRDSLRMRIADPATRARLVDEMERNMRRRGGAGSLLITSTRDTSILGRRLDAVARARDTTPIEAAIADHPRRRRVGRVVQHERDSDIDKFMVQDFIVTDSDGSDGHPRKYGTFPKLLREYVLHEARAHAAAGGARAAARQTAKIPRLQGSRHARARMLRRRHRLRPATVADRADVRAADAARHRHEVRHREWRSLAIDGRQATRVHTAGRVR